MDDFQKRMLTNLTRRHEDKIRQHAERIKEYTGYLLARLDDGNVAAGSHYAQDIASDGQEIVARFAALEAITEMVGFIDAGGKHDSTIREALQIAVTAAENDRQAERFEAALAAMDHEEA
jgi:hypothetical protein